MSGNRGGGSRQGGGDEERVAQGFNGGVWRARKRWGDQPWSGLTAVDVPVDGQGLAVEGRVTALEEALRITPQEGPTGGAASAGTAVGNGMVRRHGVWDRGVSRCHRSAC